LGCKRKKKRGQAGEMMGEAERLRKLGEGKKYLKPRIVQVANLSLLKPSSSAATPLVYAFLQSF